MKYWLMKSEPDGFGLEDLINRPQQTEPWDGVRNYQARNMLRDEMRLGDQVFFYHSNCDEPGIVGIAEIYKEGYPDPTAFDPNNKHYDPKSKPEKPTWFLVEVKFVRKLKRTISLKELKALKEANVKPELADLALLRNGNRLSIMPVSAAQWQSILELE
jgi:predicted RNA-binding protein with PUA-like domain